ncbi:hypothetical protein GCM10010116_36320 [Microbispora rosea subsp. aerata]|nr:hypothetical protein [Microbispora rosea]GGO18014.1 hypothetical protein GCM10010116_36320 [Microbispora rosea subsp. aerata]GIH56732.1 hypothetical protein Mro02_36460 [Microbispora rosea subsp. aerata]GLJ82105.1 hypothetical protein GCM10017588_08300 [Microbispora rosea subsp. aerata]
MARDGGVEVSRSALRNARKDFEEALELLAPGASTRQVTPVAFAEGGAVKRLLSRREAVGGFWDAATGFHLSLTQAESAVNAVYAEIATTLGIAAERLEQAVRNLDAGEQAGARHAGTADV